MIKVLNIISDTNIGGAGRAVLTYLKHMDRGDFEAAVALPEGSLLTERIRALGIRAFEVNAISDKSMDLSGIKELKKVIKEYQPDIVHTHGSFSGRVAGRQCGKTIIYTRHSVFPVPAKISKGPGKLANKLINEHYADRIIAVSPAAVENLTDGGIRGDIIDVVFNGVEQVEPAPAERRAALREELGIGPDVFTAAIMARIIDYKGQMDIIEAASLLKKKGLDFVFLFAGTGEDSFIEQLRARIAELGLEENVKLLGFRSDVPDILSILDVQLNASYGTEATSLALLEGFSLGIPAVASEYGGNPYVVLNGENGLTFPTRDINGLAEALEKLIRDPGLRSELGSGAKRIYEDRFTAAKYAANTENVYRGTLKLK